MMLFVPKTPRATRPTLARPTLAHPTLGGLAIFMAVITMALEVTGLEVTVKEPVDYSNQVLPLLAENCYDCHGPDPATRKAGLRLDSAEGALAALRGGDRFAIVSGAPEKSELLRRVSTQDRDDVMPPPDTGKKLSQEEIDLLRRWVAEGAPFAQHWSFRPPAQPSLPTAPDLSSASWARNRIDSFVLNELHKNGLHPSPEADLYTVARRASLDLTGLPPTPEILEALITDRNPAAYEAYVDSLLASPAFGERWGRVWLDLARYADSAGFAQDPMRTIWKYRDWVIQALNENLPFDEFTVKQLAGDLLPDPDEETLVATAFHRNTMTNSEGGTDDEEWRNAAVIDRVNTTFQVWMGVTMGCAQCHNHKYDPITQKEYFRVFAVFNNTEDADRGDESPFLSTFTPEETERRAALEEEISKLRPETEGQLAAARAQLGHLRDPLLTRYVRVELPGDQPVLALSEVEVYVGETNIAKSGTARQAESAPPSPESDKPHPRARPELAIDGAVDPKPEAAEGPPVSTTEISPARDAWWELDLGEPRVIDEIVVHHRTAKEVVDRLTKIRVVTLDPERRPLWLQGDLKSRRPRHSIRVPPAAVDLSTSLKNQLLHYGDWLTPELVADIDRLERLQTELDKLRGVRTPILRELPREKRRRTHIQIRGDFRIKDEEVTPGIPQAFQLGDGLTAGAGERNAGERKAGKSDDVDANGTAEIDRLWLARWLVDDRNPLTARVTANRHWEHLFGRGLVHTSEDFGIQGEAPSHPELLDDLANDLVNSGWDIKALLRRIVTSSTYRQSSAQTPELASVDPFNQLFSRGPRFRLSAEILRDQTLAVSGLLSRKLHGPSVRPLRPELGLKTAFGNSADWTTSPGADRYRRGLYTEWRRTAPHPSMTTFDAPSREFCTVRRIRTNTPLQALVTLNDPCYVEAAQALARRILLETERHDSALGKQEQLRLRAAQGFRWCLSRPPEPHEIDELVALYNRTLQKFRHDPEAARALATEPLGPLPESAGNIKMAELAAWTVVANVLMNLDEFLARR